MEVMMPAGGGGGAGVQLTMDCEDMFKEITKKLYGEEGVLEFPAVERSVLAAEHRHIIVDYELDGAALKPEDHITAFGLAALMQNGFPPPGILNANFQPKTNPAAEDKWTASEDTLQWSQSRIASYNPAQKLFKCAECECVGFLSRVAEHWLGTHSNARVFQCPQCAYGSSWARCVRAHLAREHNVPDDQHSEALFKNNPVLDEITKYLQRLKAKVDSATPKTPPPPSQQASATSHAHETRAAATSPTVPAGDSGGAPGPPKRYCCAACPYATDRRDLFTRHENIHRDEKPFECYVCQKQFNRADHVKKHFLRMHRDHPYDLNRIRRQLPKTPPGYYAKQSPSDAAPAIHIEYARQPQTKVERPQLVKSEAGAPPPPTPAPVAHKSGASKKKGDKRYSCCYCSWSGVDNWCLKRHLNTHLKPFVCALCDYKAARAERLTTHVAKVHNKKACGKCSFLADDSAQLAAHLQDQHHIENRNIKVPNAMLRNAAYTSAASTTAVPTFGSEIDGIAAGALSESVATVRIVRREPKQHGAARLFNYMEASDGSEEEYGSEEAPVPQPPPRYRTVVTERSVLDYSEAGGAGAYSGGMPRDKENACGARGALFRAAAAPLLATNQCLRY